jgi:very-short-patch-repair endonuclease
MAAVLAHGDGAALSHRSAAELWRLLRPAGGVIHVSIPTGSGRRRRDGIRLHRRPRLVSTAITRRRNIPVTTPARTLADLRHAVPPAQLRRAIRQAEVLGLPTGLKASEATRSELEHLFLRLCERHRLPAPEVNVQVGPYEVDFLWRSERLIVETNGYRYHRGAQAFEDDHQRDLVLRSHGCDVRHFTYRQVVESPAQVATAVAAALRR